MDDLPTLHARVSTLETELRLIKDRHARYQKIQSLEQKNEMLIQLLTDINNAIPFPMPEFFTPEIQKRLSEVLTNGNKKK